MSNQPEINYYIALSNYNIRLCFVLKHKYKKYSFPKDILL